LSPDGTVVTTSVMGRIDSPAGRRQAAIDAEKAAKRKAEEEKAAAVRRAAEAKAAAEAARTADEEAAARAAEAPVETTPQDDPGMLGSVRKRFTNLFGS
ncbi:MAG: hypothetical protein ABJ011_16805, partial [Nitratireductor sp.]